MTKMPLTSNARPEPMPDLRPTRHVKIAPAVPWWEVLALYAVAALIGVLLAAGGAL